VLASSHGQRLFISKGIDYKKRNKFEKCVLKKTTKNLNIGIGLDTETAPA